MYLKEREINTKKVIKKKRNLRKKIIDPKKM
jgi:hypothetical protein